MKFQCGRQIIKQININHILVQIKKVLYVHMTYPYTQTTIKMTRAHEENGSCTGSFTIKRAIYE